MRRIVDSTTFKSLFTREGRAALEAASSLQPRERDFLPNFTTLSRRFAPDIARAALEIEILRREAAVKFAEESPDPAPGALYEGLFSEPFPSDPHA